MKLTIRPDETRPSGGYAILTLSDGTLSETDIMLSVFDAFSERHLGENGWQAEPVSFGPYTVTTTPEGADITIGPEIVNQLEEYTALKFTIGDISAAATWPDDVIPAPGAAIIGGLHIGEPTKTKPVTLTPVLHSNDTQGDDDTRNETDNGEAEAVSESSGKKRILIIAILLLALMIAAAIWYFTQSQKPDSEAKSDPPSPVTTAPTATQATPCSNDAFAALRGQGFVASQSLISQCSGTANPDTVLGLLEDGAANNESEALLVFGKIYDAKAVDETLENQIGLTFSDAPSTAALYYARAKEAGSSEAAERLQALCQRMASMTDTLTTAAFQDYCNE